jgi:hypothetical protein
LPERITCCPSNQNHTGAPSSKNTQVSDERLTWVRDSGWRRPHLKTIPCARHVLQGRPFACHTFSFNLDDFDFSQPEHVHDHLPRFGHGHFQVLTGDQQKKPFGGEPQEDTLPFLLPT